MLGFLDFKALLALDIADFIFSAPATLLKRLPRNPQIAYCVDQYVSNQISINGDIIIAGAETASKIDLSVLPKNY